MSSKNLPQYFANAGIDAKPLPSEVYHLNLKIMPLKVRVASRPALAKGPLSALKLSHQKLPDILYSAFPSMQHTLGGKVTEGWLSSPIFLCANISRTPTS